MPVWAKCHTFGPLRDVITGGVHCADERVRGCDRLDCRWRDYRGCFAVVCGPGGSDSIVDPYARGVERWHRSDDCSARDGSDA